MEHKTSLTFLPIPRQRAQSLSELSSQPTVASPSKLLSPPVSPRKRGSSLGASFQSPLSSPRVKKLPVLSRLPTIGNLVSSPRVVEKTPASPHRLTTISEFDLRELLSKVDVDLNEVQQHSTKSEWAEIVQAAAEDVIGGEPVGLEAGSKLPELLLRAVQNAGYRDNVACRVICLFHPFNRPEALLLLASQLASGPKPPSAKLKKAVQAAVRETCTHFMKTQRTVRLLWLLRLCPEQFRPPALSGHALFWAFDACPGLLLEYATRGWDLQLGTTMQLIQEVDPKEHLCELTELAEMFLAHGGNNRMYAKIAVEIYKSVVEGFKANWIHLNSFIANVSPQLLSAGLGLPPPDPEMLVNRPLVKKDWPVPSPLHTPEQLRKRLHRETGITFTSTGWLMPKELPQQWDGLLTYFHDAALLNPADQEPVNLARAICAAVYYRPVPGDFVSMVNSWVQRLGEMGGGLDQLRLDLRKILMTMDF